MKKSRMVMKFYPYGALMINRGNRTLFVIHLCCCSQCAVSINSAAATILIAKLANLAGFVANILIQNIIRVLLCILSLYILFIFKLYII